MLPKAVQPRHWGSAAPIGTAVRGEAWPIQRGEAGRAGESPAKLPDSQSRNLLEEAKLCREMTTELHSFALHLILGEQMKRLSINMLALFLLNTKPTAAPKTVQSPKEVDRLL